MGYFQKVEHSLRGDALYSVLVDSATYAHQLFEPGVPALLPLLGHLPECFDERHLDTDILRWLIDSPPETQETARLYISHLPL